MSSYNLNELLKNRAKREAGRPQSIGAAEQAVDLGDVSRVKVLSPGRQVFKRFIRNRLAVLGTAILLLMFFWVSLVRISMS